MNNQMELWFYQDGEFKSIWPCRNEETEWDMRYHLGMKGSGTYSRAPGLEIREMYPTKQSDGSTRYELRVSYRASEYGWDIRQYGGY